MICRLCRVSGRVQGVFYRASAAAQARRLGVTGHARNLPGGDVEVLACGEVARVEELIAWLAVGPSAAVVVSVETRDVLLAEPPGVFTTG